MILNGFNIVNYRDSLAITLILTIGINNRTTLKPTTPSHNSVTFQRDIVGNEELSEFNSLRNYYDEFEADVHGQISWGLFDKNGDLIEEELIEGISTLRGCRYDCNLLFILRFIL